MACPTNAFTVNISRCTIRHSAHRLSPAAITHSAPQSNSSDRGSPQPHHHPHFRIQVNLEQCCQPALKQCLCPYVADFAIWLHSQIITYAICCAVSPCASTVRSVIKAPCGLLRTASQNCPRKRPYRSGVTASTTDASSFHRVKLPFETEAWDGFFRLAYR